MDCTFKQEMERYIEMLINVIELKKFDHNIGISVKTIEIASIKIVMHICISSFKNRRRRLIHAAKTCWWRAKIEQSDYFFNALLGNWNDIYSTRKPKIIW